MKSVYQSPLRVYLCLGLLGALGLFSVTQLPTSLFPNSSKPRVWIHLPYGQLTPEEFAKEHGRSLESQVQRISKEGISVDRVEATYESGKMSLKVDFEWGTRPQEAKSEVQSIVYSYAARLPEEVRNGIQIWGGAQNSGFLAISFYSAKRSLDQIYKLINPILQPELAQVADAQGVDLWNPSKKEIRIELIPEAVASLGLLPKTIESALRGAIAAYSGGSVTEGPSKFLVEISSRADTIDKIRKIAIPTRSNQNVHLSDVANISYDLATSNSRSFKTSGAPSLILFATPKPGANVKRMSEEIIEIVKTQSARFPQDVQYKVLVDPSEFIRAAIRNVFFEVGLGATLAVLVLFLFIGSLRNTVTASIEIPLSMFLAFILMKLSGMNLNLISLGGLALSAGMNVDASVVVLENIMRHFREYSEKTKIKGEIPTKERLRIILKAVEEVRFPVIAAMISSLIVFIPLAFTSELTYAILGDLAKAVVFSHGFCAFVALILVPTIRLQLMKRASDHQVRSIVPMQRLQDLYAKVLSYFLDHRPLRWGAALGLIATLAALLSFVLPQLPREIVGKPDTDWMFVTVKTKGNTLLRQMETQAEEVEARLLKELGHEFQYTFNNIRNPNRASVMARLKDKKRMEIVWKDMERFFLDSPYIRYDVRSWNPSELPIPDPPDLKLSIRTGSLEERALLTKEFRDLLREKKLLPRVWSKPNVNRTERIVIKPHQEQWAEIKSSGLRLAESDLSEIARVATDGKVLGWITIDEVRTPISLRYPFGSVQTVEDLRAIPVRLGERLVPFKALADVSVERLRPPIYRENGSELFLIEGRQNKGDESETPQALEEIRSLLKQDRYQAIIEEDPHYELNDALQQLVFAVALSILFIFVTLVFQFGNFLQPLLVMTAIPLGLIGVLLSLYVFQSTLSLNSVLGLILLNGIAVANSIILVDFIRRLVKEGHAPREAALMAARKRLRPICITSLTTILGMLPIALGLGEGGKILQPLGVAVSGGLWFSTLLTLFMVPTLQVSFLKRAQLAKPAPAVPPPPPVLPSGLKRDKAKEEPKEEPKEEKNDSVPSSS